MSKLDWAIRRMKKRGYSVAEFRPGYGAVMVKDHVITIFTDGSGRLGNLLGRR